MALQRSAKRGAQCTLQALLSQTVSSISHNLSKHEAASAVQPYLASVRWLVGIGDVDGTGGRDGSIPRLHPFNRTFCIIYHSPYYESIEQNRLYSRRLKWMSTMSGQSEKQTDHCGQGQGLSSLLDRLPPALVPYAQLSRLDKPIGTWLLAWPCFWSIVLASSHPLSLETLHMLSLFGGGALILRGAGCTINDLWDKELDRQVERTKLRPLASGELSTRQGIAWLGVQLTAGLGILLQLNQFSQALGASSLVLVVTYPLMKRITGWPQAFLGLTFNWGALLGWAAVNNNLDLEVVLPLYAGGIAWTLVYDTIYAHQDKADDVLVGVKSTALTFGRYNRTYLSAFAVANITCMALAGHAAGCGAIFDGFLTLSASQLAWQVLTVNFNNPEDCANKFKSNFWYGLILFTGIGLDKLL
jgi:4-hydroxybenzoate polyprenyltransferase